MQQAICYKDKALVVTTYNKLSEKYERFIYSADSVKDEDIAKLEALVSIEGLVGEQEIPELKVPEADPKDFVKETEKPTEATTETSSEASSETDESQKAIDEEMDKIREQAENRQDGDVETVDSTEATSKSGT